MRIDTRSYRNRFQCLFKCFRRLYQQTDSYRSKRKLFKAPLRASPRRRKTQEEEKDARRRQLRLYRRTSTAMVIIFLVMTQYHSSELKN